MKLICLLTPLWTVVGGGAFAEVHSQRSRACTGRSFPIERCGKCSAWLFNVMSRDVRRARLSTQPGFSKRSRK